MTDYSYSRPADFGIVDVRAITLEHAVDLVRDNQAVTSEIVDLATKFEAFLLDKPTDTGVDVTFDVSDAQAMRRALIDLKRQLGTNLGLA